MTTFPRSPRLLILCNDSTGSVDAIRDASAQLGAALAAAGATVTISQRPDGARRKAWLGIRWDDWDIVLLQYNPFLYGRWGFAPWLVIKLWRRRLHRSRPRIALMVHEPFVPMIGWRWTLMGLWQRTQLLGLRAASDVVFASIGVWAEMLRRLPPQRPTSHLSVGSNLPDRRGQRAAARRRIDAGEGKLVVATLSSGHPSHDLVLVDASLRAIATQGRQAIFLALGAGARLPPFIPPAIRVEKPGPLPADELATRLAAADIFLAPFIDGVSTRRGSAMAALQHGLAVVTTDGPLTDRLFREVPGAIRLVPTARPDLFAAEVGRLAERPDERAALGAAGAQLYESALDWPVVARRLLAICTAEL